jgi:hypothetical protein
MVAHALTAHALTVPYYVTERHGVQGGLWS